MNRRLFSMIGTPILALIAASIYTEWRAGKTALEVEQFCKAFTPGLTAQEFAKIALANGYTVNDLGAGAPNLMASKVAYTFRREVYGCVAERDAKGTITATRPEHSFVEE
jgi:hypothetical protein